MEVRLVGTVREFPINSLPAGCMECTLIQKAPDGIEDEIFLGDELKPFMGREVEIVIRSIAH